MWCFAAHLLFRCAPSTGFEPATSASTGPCSSAELRRQINCTMRAIHYGLVSYRIRRRACRGAIPQRGTNARKSRPNPCWGWAAEASLAFALAAPPARGVGTFKTIESGEETKVGVPLHGLLPSLPIVAPEAFPGADEYNTQCPPRAQHIYRVVLFPVDMTHVAPMGSARAPHR
jgi:hypothetical protein